MMIELSDQLQLLRGVVPEVAQRLADMGVVFLLDVSVVVLAVGPGMSELELLIDAVLVKLGVDEGVVVVGVDAEPGKR